jgi:hypothetical protein
MNVTREARLSTWDVTNRETITLDRRKAFEQNLEARYSLDGTMQ